MIISLKLLNSEGFTRRFMDMGKFLIRNVDNGFVFFLQDPTGKLILTSSQSYKTVQSAAKGATSVQKNASHARIEDQTELTGVQLNPKFEIFSDSGQTNSPVQFRLRAKNGQIIAISGAVFQSLSDCLAMIEQVRRNTAGSRIDIVIEE